MISNERSSPYGHRPQMPLRPPVPEIILKHAQIEIGRASFMLMLRQNARGRFLRITEKTPDAFHSLIIPDTGLAAFQQVLDKMFLATQHPEAGPAPQPQEVRIERKVFIFVLDQAPEGSFLRIIEQGGNHNNQLIILIGGLAAFKRELDAMVAAANEPAGMEMLPLTIFGEDILKNGQMQAEHRTFIFQLKQNERGRFLRIIEEKPHRLNTIIIPAESLEEFKKWVVDMARAAKKKPAKKKA
jgi:hypothetical protein